MKIYITDADCLSLSKINSDLKEFLQQTSHTVCEYDIWPLGYKDEVLIQHYLFRRSILRRTEKGILIQPLDGTIIKKQHVWQINRWDVVVTPSTIGKKIMEDNGVTIPIKVIPNYWEDEILVDNGFFSKKFTNNKWTFYTESSGWERKNIRNILKYFIEEFHDNPDVRLVIKLSEKSRYEIVVPDNIKCEIVIIEDLLPKEDLYSLMINSDCYVCLSYMEGFCIPLLNAAVLKKDIICLDTKISGYSDFLNKDNSIMISCKEIPILNLAECIAIFETDSIWEEPNYSEYKFALRLSYEKKYNFNKKDNFGDYHKDVVMRKYLELVESKSFS